MHAASQVLKTKLEKLLFLYDLTSTPTYAWGIDKNEINAMQQTERNSYVFKLVSSRFLMIHINCG